ncbi:MAG: transposase [Verrucomicrobiales bacterium]|nr:transposase [Verrucomicrobiae bacterium]
MKGKRHTTEEKIRILRKADTGTSGQLLCCEHQISEQTFYRWKNEPSGARSTGMECEPGGRSRKAESIRDAGGQPRQVAQGTGEGMERSDIA